MKEEKKTRIAIVGVGDALTSSVVEALCQSRNIEIIPATKIEQSVSPLVNYVIPSIINPYFHELSNKREVGLNFENRGKKADLGSKVYVKHKRKKKSHKRR